MPDDFTAGDIRDMVLAAYREVVGDDPPHGLNTAPGEVSDWDSLTQIRLVHTLEQTLGCVLDERCLTVGPTLAKLVQEASAAVRARKAR